MSTIDPGKLKVVELRSELSSRGLDIKGNKAVLVERLREALMKETKTVLPDTSIADTSTEDFNTTQESTIEQESENSEKEDEKVDTNVSTKTSVPVQKSDSETPKPIPVTHSEPMQITTEAACENGEDGEQAMEEDVVTESAEESIKTTVDNTDNIPATAIPETDKPAVDKPATVKPKTDKSVIEQPKGEKRRRSSPSPQRVQRKRSRSPIKEDEPEVDNNKVLLSWYDSDLNLQIEKQSLLSAKPLYEGAFGYSWAGARTTHGVKVGKVCYEVKLTEELKWEDFVRQVDKKRDNQRSDRRDRRRQDRKVRDNVKKDQEVTKVENEEKSESKEKQADDKETTEPSETDNAAESKGVENVLEENPLEVTTDPETKLEEVKNEDRTEDIKEAEGAADDKSNGTEPTDNSDVKENQKSDATEADVPSPVPITKHVFRCGWSISDTSLQLGETQYSYGFDSHGKFVNNKDFVDYGAPFAVGDVIGAYVNIDTETVEFTFTVNGTSHGVALTIPRSEFPEEGALFPHLLTRNFGFELNLGNREEPWFPHPSDLSEYIYIQSLEDKFQGPLRPSSRSECEVIMMCGLPGSGKSHWVKEILKENSDKKYTVIGTTNLLEKMTINGQPLKDSYKNRWNIILDRLMKCANTLVDKAAVRRRNIIIDQTNVFPSAQRRKMRLFEGFKRRAVIVVVNDEEQAKRRALQEAQDGKDAPDSTLLEMKANMSLPKCGDWLEEVKFVELGEDEAKTVVEKYNSDGKAAGFGGSNRRGGYRDNRGHPYRWNHSNSRRDYRDNYRDNRPYQNNRFRPPGGFQNRRPAGGSNRDYRDNRGPPRDSRNNRSGSAGRHDRWSGGRERNQSVSNYNRSQRPQGNRSQNWQGGTTSSWQSSQPWAGSQGGQYQNWGQGNWGGQNQWKGGYGQGGYSQGGGYSNWNYYGQYANNWQNNGG